MTDIANAKEQFKSSVKAVNESLFSSVGTEWLKMLESRYEILKEELIDAKPETVESKRSAAKELKNILKAVKASIDR